MIAKTLSDNEIAGMVEYHSENGCGDDWRREYCSEGKCDFARLLEALVIARSELADMKTKRERMSDLANHNLTAREKLIAELAEKDARIAALEGELAGKK